MNVSDNSDIPSDVRHFLEVMGLGWQHVTSDGLRVILAYAILGYLNKHKSVSFPLEVATALRTQTALPLTVDMQEITGKLQKLKQKEKAAGTPVDSHSREGIKTFLSDCMHKLEEEHHKLYITFRESVSFRTNSKLIS